MNELLDKIIKELEDKSEQLKELSADEHCEKFLFEHVGILKSIEIIKKYKDE
jgi:hypothetical protein